MWANENVRLPATLRYLVARPWLKDSAELYVIRGLGLERRARRLAAHWQPHLDASRAAQERYLAPAARLTVLGAGRLLDFSPIAARRFEHLRFVDADPLCLPFWQRAYSARHEAVIADVTTRLAQWTRQLSQHPQTSLPNLLSYIANLRAPTPPTPPDWLRNSDAILSLNLLSQIGLAWHDRVQAQLTRRYGAAALHSHTDAWQAAVAPGARSLVDAHMAMLNASGAAQLLLLTDLLFLEYQGPAGPYHPRRAAPPPVAWQAGQFTGHAQLQLSGESALYGLECPANLLPHYAETAAENWLWHIRPLGTEPPAHSGSLHLVAACHFRRRNTPTPDVCKNA